MIINKYDFAEIINRLKEYTKLQEQINKLFEGCIDNREQDFCNAGGICIGHESIVVKLLEDMFETDTISWWIYELEYGTKYYNGCIVDSNNNFIDLSSADKLYDFLIENLKEGKK